METVVYLDQAKKDVAFRDAILRLRKNRDFKKIFEEGYFKDEAARIAQAIVNYEMQGDVDQRNLSEQFKAIGHVQNWLMTKTMLGNQMEKEIKEYEESLKQEIKETAVDDITGDEYEVEE